MDERTKCIIYNMLLLLEKNSLEYPNICNEDTIEKICNETGLKKAEYLDIVSQRVVDEEPVL